jgi:tetratricopeptide (TPR) repeat protein
MRKGQRGKKIGPSPSRSALSPKDRLRQQAYALRSQRDFVSAKPLLGELYKLEPDNIPLALDLGEAYMETEDFAAAVSLYAKMIEHDPKHLAAVTNLGGALIRQGKLADAKAILQYALELDPKSIHARINLGSVLQASGDRKANLDNALEAVQIDPSSSLAFNNLGSAFSDMAMFKEAKHAYETAVMLDAHQVDALINLGAVEARLGDPRASCQMYEKVLTQLPAAAKQRADAVKFYAAFEYLEQGILDKGWDYYEGGFSPLVPATGARTPRRNFGVPRWNGESLNGKTLLVWREQGLGDELLFATCLHELEALGGSIIVECDRRLVPVFERSFPSYKIRQETYLPNHGMVSPYSDFDLHVPLGSLMKYFRRDIKDFERSGAYIKTDPAKVAKFEVRLAPYKEDYRLVGICWRSGKLDPVRNLGYTTLDEWAEVLQTPGFKFVNLQYGECEAELQQAEEKYGVEILRWPDLNLRNDLDDIFALMNCLDVVASVQTAVLTMSSSAGVRAAGIKSGGWTQLGLRGKSPWFGTQVQVASPNEAIKRIEATHMDQHFGVDGSYLRLISANIFNATQESKVGMRLLVGRLKPLLESSLDLRKESKVTVSRGCQLIGHPENLVDLGLLYFRGSGDKDLPLSLFQELNVKGKLKPGSFIKLARLYASDTGDWKGALDIAENEPFDLNLDNESLLSVASILVGVKEFSLAEDLVRDLYKSRTYLKNFFTELACIAIKLGDVKVAKNYVSIDISESRVSAQHLAFFGSLIGPDASVDYALDIIRRAYDLGENVKDGYIRLALRRYRKFKDLQESREIAHLDFSLGRASQKGFDQILTAYFEAGQFNEVLGLLNKYGGKIPNTSKIVDKLLELEIGGTLENKFAKNQLRVFASSSANQSAAKRQ